MNLTIGVGEPEPLEGFAEARREYLDELGQAQEPLLEVLVPGAECRWIRARNGETCGYAIVHESRLLIEFYLFRPYWVFGETVLAQVVRQLDLGKAWIKSFDSLLLSSALRLQRGIETLGLLVRDYVPRPLPGRGRPEYATRVGEPSDLDRLLAVDQDVFSSPERLSMALDRRWIRVFERADALIGFGLLRPVVPGRPDVDVGIAVDRPFRGKGYATHAFADLVRECLREGKNPVCGCSNDNRASRHLGERVGMVSRHRLLAVRF